MKKFIKITLFSVLFCATSWLFSPTVHAQTGNLLIAPTRVVFEGRTRFHAITFSNRGTESALFRVTIVDMSMDENGDMKRIENPDKNFKSAARLIRYAPRQITIPAGGVQVVRLSLRKPNNLEEGEYRSHVYFRAIPSESTGRVVGAGGAREPGGLSFRLTPVFGVTIPIIVRHGKLAAKGGMSDLSYTPANGEKPAKLGITLERSGDRSLFGDLVATYHPKGGSPLVVGEINRLAVYTPNNKRRVTMTLRVPDGVTLGTGKLNLAYRETQKAGGKIIAQGDLDL